MRVTTKDLGIDMKQRLGIGMGINGVEQLRG